MNRQFHIYASFTKSSIDTARRTVTGIAQVEDATPDTQGDIVDFNASKKAFAAWPGNVREMHGPKAVGKSVSWWADPVTKRIYVRARISEGAEDTWKKVLDGTLSGFSIGGQQIAARRGINKLTGRAENRITAYRLNELSLVDSPANPNCVITAIHKRNGHLVTTDVLGQGGKMSTTAAAKTAIRKFAGSVDADDEVVVIKKSDIELGRSDGLVVLKKSASFVAIKKDDMGAMTGGDGEGMTDDGGQGAGDMGNIDLEDHATNMANAHKDLCKMAGIDDHVGHYEDATQGDDDQDDANDGSVDTGAEGDDMQMGRGFGRRGFRKSRSRRGTSDREIQKRIDKALGTQKAEMDAAFAKQIDDIKKAVGGTVAARKTDAGEGEPLQKTVGDLLGDGSSLEKGSGARYRALVKEKADLDTETKTLIAKMASGRKLEPADDIRRGQVLKRISQVEVELAELASNAQSV